MPKFDPDKPLPAIPYPFEVSREERIKQLEGYLEVKILERQRPNIEFVINMYRTGQLKSLLGPPNGRNIYVCSGQVFEENSLPKELPNSENPVWFEGVSQQMMQQPERDKMGQQQMKLWSSYEEIPSTMHKILARLRLVPLDPHADNKDLPYITVEVSNDTGSTIQTVFTSDLANLNYDESTYHAVIGYESIITAAGPVIRLSIGIELMIVDTDRNRMTPWFKERAIVVDNTTSSFGLERLSGRQIRRELYFATDRQNKLFMGLSKNAVFQYMK